MNPDSYQDEKLRIGSIQITIYDFELRKRL